MRLLAKRISKRRLQLPTEIGDRFAEVSLFEVSVENGRIVLRPAAVRTADEVRRELDSRKLRARDVAEAVDWARSPR